MLRTTSSRLAIAFFLCLSGCVCSQTTDTELTRVIDTSTRQTRLKSFDQQKIQGWLQEIAGQEHPFGSPRQSEVANYLAQQATALGASVVVEDFIADTPNPVLLKNPSAPASHALQKSGRNIYARANLRPEADCVVGIGSHYDTKIISDGPYLGANDSGSSSALLLEMIRRLRLSKDALQLRCDLMMIWFDGEESILPEWNDGEFRHPLKKADHTYGSRHAAARLVTCPSTNTLAPKCLPPDLGSGALVSLIIVDMVGSPNLRFTRESQSSKTLISLLEKVLKSQGREQLLESNLVEVGDDHVPFRQAGVQAIDLIDFSNTQHWHQPSDTIANLSLQSLEIAYEVAASMALTMATTPKLFSK